MGKLCSNCAPSASFLAFSLLMPAVALVNFLLVVSLTTRNRSQARRITITLPHGRGLRHRRDHRPARHLPAVVRVGSHGVRNFTGRTGSEEERMPP